MVNYAFNLSGKQFGYYLVDTTNETNWSEITEFERILGLWNKGKEKGVTPIFKFSKLLKVVYTGDDFYIHQIPIFLYITEYEAIGHRSLLAFTGQGSLFLSHQKKMEPLN